MRCLKCLIPAAALLAAAAGAAAESGPEIMGIEVSAPMIPFPSHGDLWLTTWDGDDTVFASWGDGYGPEYDESRPFSHHGLMKLTGRFPDQLRARTRERNRNFICLIFINMGGNYELNADGFVYAFGVEGEINISGKVYLARMPVSGILDDDSWEYYAGSAADGGPTWVRGWDEAAVIRGLSHQPYLSLYPNMLFAAAWRPGTGRCLAMTGTNEVGALFQAPNPWGPWTLVDDWFRGMDSEWYPSYMPGIVTRDMGDDFFYFTASGRKDLDPPAGDPGYRFKLGKITLIVEE